MRAAKLAEKASKQENVDFLGYLHDRWQEEQEYEDWNDYCKAIEKRLQHKLLKSNPDPMQFALACDNNEVVILEVKEDSVEVRYIEN